MKLFEFEQVIYLWQFQWISFAFISMEFPVNARTLIIGRIICHLKDFKNLRVSFVWDAKEIAPSFGCYDEWYCDFSLPHFPVVRVNTISAKVFFSPISSSLTYTIIIRNYKCISAWLHSTKATQTDRKLHAKITSLYEWLRKTTECICVLSKCAYVCMLILKVVAEIVLIKIMHKRNTLENL